MSTQALARRVWRLEEREALGFAAFLLRLSDGESRVWLTSAFDRMSAESIISPAPADLWQRPHAEKEAFLHMLTQTIGGGHQGVAQVIRQEWHAWEQEHTA